MRTSRENPESGAFLARSLIILAIVGIIAAPTGSAFEAQGALTLRGPFSMPADSSTTFDSLLAAYDAQTLNAKFTFEAPTLHVEYYEADTITIPGLASKQTSITERSWDLSNVTAGIAPGGDNAGLFGIYPTHTDSANFSSANPLTLEARPASSVPNGTQSTTRDTPDVPYYYQSISRPHAYANAPGTLKYSGAGSLKIRGLHVAIHASENESSWQTGFATVSPVESVARWFHWSFDSAAVKLDSDSQPIEVAATSASPSWAGTATSGAATGAMTGPSGTLSSNGSPLMLDGNLRAVLIPMDEGSWTLTNLAGNLQGTSLQFVRTVAPLPQLGGISWVPLVVVGATVASMGSALVVFKRRSPRATGSASLLTGTTPSVGDAAQLADAAGDEANWRDAATLYARARKFAPRDGLVPAKQGMMLIMLHDWDAAFDAFDAASRLLLDGEADRMAALCALEAGRVETAEACLVVCAQLATRSELLDQIEGEGQFDAIIRDSDALRVALVEARARLAS